MNTLPKIGLLLLMLLLVAGAFVLPKFVQRAEPPTSEQDLAAALAAVQLDEPEQAETEEPAPPSALRSDEKYDSFFAALDDSDFETAREELLAASKSEDTDPEIIAELTSEMEKSVEALSAPPVKESVLAEVDVPAPVKDDLSIAEPAGAVGPATEEPGAAEASAPVREVVAIAPVSPPVPEPVAKPVIDQSEIIGIMSMIQSGDFAGAEKSIGALNPEAPAATVSLLKSSLASAKAKQIELAESKKELETSRKQLNESKQMLTSLQEENVSQLKESVAELKKATQSAQEAVAEASKLRAEIGEVKMQAAAAPAATPPTPKEAPKPKPKPIEIPETSSIAFAFDSTYLSEKSREVLSAAVKELKDEPRLTVQLRGHSDTAGTSEYNGILAQARGEVAKDFLIEKGIAGSRVAVVAFGETQAQQSGDSPEKLRRVDLVFRGE